MADKAKLRVRVVDGVEIPEHRHGTKGWHWAWSTHEGQEAATFPAHKGIYRKDPRTPAQVKAGVGLSNSLKKGYVKKADQAAVLAEVEEILGARALDEFMAYGQ